MICGQKIHNIDDAAVDHIEQYWRGGQTIPDNARLTHRYCNVARSRLDDSDSPIIVTRRNLGRVRKARVEGAITREQYRKTILEILLKMGGKSTQREVFDEFEKMKGNLLNFIDKQILNDGYTPRWQKNIAAERYRLVTTGFLKKDSPRGEWEITEKGRQEYEKLR